MKKIRQIQTNAVRKLPSADVLKSNALFESLKTNIGGDNMGLICKFERAAIGKYIIIL